MPKAAMSAKEWRRRMQRYADGVFTFGRGQKPRQNSRWSRSLHDIERCPVHRAPVGSALVCRFGYHGSKSHSVIPSHGLLGGTEAQASPPQSSQVSPSSCLATLSVSSRPSHGPPVTERKPGHPAGFDGCSSYTTGPVKPEVTECKRGYFVRSDCWGESNTSAVKRRESVQPCTETTNGLQPASAEGVGSHVARMRPFLGWSVTFRFQGKHGGQSGELVEPTPGASQHQTVPAELLRPATLPLDAEEDVAYGHYLPTLWRRQASVEGRILEQLPDGVRARFPVVLTYKYACDRAVIVFLRARTLGNSPGAMKHNLQELHSEEHLRKVSQYLHDCDTFRSSRSNLGMPVTTFQPPPQLEMFRSAKWFLAAYVRDVWSRLPTLKAAVTSTFGEILKIDSTKKVCMKLQGASVNMAAWATNVGNERGEVLISVLT
ncbi:hypothetical protein LSAT2_018107 [Lamellibrachia satsuma]|nr:hypothetical protein LSAT2_018107 [Lamellibrachia satsuma]